MNYAPRHRPWRHQDEAEAKWGYREYLALLAAMRTGKTKMVIDHYGKLELEHIVQNLCVIAPGGVYETWEAECKEHFSADLKERAKIFVWQSGMGATKRKELERFLAITDRPRVLLMNVEALSAVQEARDVILTFLKSGKVLTAIDECTTIGNHKSKRTKFINKEVAAESDFRVIMSGLPTPRDPLSLYSMFEFLDWRILGYKSFYVFRARHAIMFNIVVGGRSVPIIKGFQDLDGLRNKIEPHSFRVRLEDIYDVPEPVYIIRNVTMTPEQKRIYKELKTYATAQLDAMSHVTATIVIARLIRLHQILCGHTVDENGIEHEIPENRTKELLELLEEYDGKAIIWCSYDYDIKKVTAALEKEYGKGCCARFWGGNRTTREAEEVSFKEDPNCRFMVATPAAGKFSRKWSIADLVIYYSNTDDLENRDQSEKRPMAVGKERPITYVDLMVRDTVDEKFVKSMRSKIDMNSQITGDTWRAWLV